MFSLCTTKDVEKTPNIVLLVHALIFDEFVFHVLLRTFKKDCKRHCIFGTDKICLALLSMDTKDLKRQNAIQIFKNLIIITESNICFAKHSGLHFKVFVELQVPWNMLQEI